MVKRVAGAGDLKLSHDLVVEDLVIIGGRYKFYPLLQIIAKSYILGHLHHQRLQLGSEPLFSTSCLLNLLNVRSL